MSAITASDVKKLRDMTGAGMMDCKQALEEAQGDFDGAVEVLRKKGQKMMAKRADRESNEGVVIAITNSDNTKGILVGVCCETDFVAKNDDFVAFAKSLADAALANFPADKAAFLAMPFDGVTVEEKLVERTGVVGEKIEIRDYAAVAAAQVAPYIHMGYRAGVLVALNQTGEAAFEAGKNCAMQIAAMKPIAVSEAEVSQDAIDTEVRIRTEILANDPKNAGKPTDILEKMVKGSLNKFFQEVTLLQQDYVKGNKQTVADYLKSVNKDLTVTAFKHLFLK
jgi:elongation factor Ts